MFTVVKNYKPLKCFTVWNWLNNYDFGLTYWASQVVLVVKKPAADVDLGGAGPIPREDPLKEGRLDWRRAWLPTPVFLPGESPRTEEPGGLQSIVLQRIRQLKQLSKHARIYIPWTQLHVIKYVSTISLQKPVYYLICRRSNLCQAIGRMPETLLNKRKCLSLRSSVCREDRQETTRWVLPARRENP